MHLSLFPSFVFFGCRFRCCYCLPRPQIEVLLPLYHYKKMKENSLRQLNVSLSYVKEEQMRSL